MTALTLPKTSKIVVGSCVAIQACALYAVASLDHRSIWVSAVGFLGGALLTDWISGLAHFSFDYIWPARTPIMGPIAVEFQEHHESPTLDPSAVLTNLTKGAYAALPVAGLTWLVAQVLTDSTVSFLAVAILMAMSFWAFGFHQIHSYAHMGGRFPPEEFKRAVEYASGLPLTQQAKEFARLFEGAEIPWVVRLLQRCRLFLRPEVHWRHHLCFESDFASVNGWSDPLMNWLYRRVARRKKARNGDVYPEIGVTRET
jgi:Lipid desaturase domain